MFLTNKKHDRLGLSLWYTNSIPGVEITANIQPSNSSDFVWSYIFLSNSA
jgi:hypothetical protein